MAIGYTELDFVNGSVPALSAANLNHIDEGVKACADQLDAETAPGRALVEAADVAAQRAALGLGTAALAGDASESAKGVVQLGATGVPSATKVPKALGADLVALITAAGYTLSPAEGTASLDGIADGTTYKRVLAAKATALNAGTFDAATCKAFGIGGYKTIASGSLNAVVLPGLYSFYVGDVTEDPSSAGSTGIYGLLVFGLSATYIAQVAFETGKYIWFRSGNSLTSTWGAWKQVWNDASDGNGGQPPAPKPIYATTGIGCWSSTTNTLPANGSYAVICFKSGAIYVAVAGVAGGVNLNTDLGTTGIDKIMYWRTA